MKTDPKPTGAAEHFERAASWEADRESRRDRSERNAWRVAAASVCLTLAMGIALAYMAPLKRTVPYVFAVEKATGNVELVHAADDRTIVGYQELLDKHWARRYVSARESYVYRLLQTDYDTVLGLSSDEVGRVYARTYEGGAARDKQLGTQTEMLINVRSITLERDAFSAKAVVRFERITKMNESDMKGRSEFFVATLAFQYEPSMKGAERDLIANPLGYRVTAYRVDAELAPVAAARTY